MNPSLQLTGIGLRAPHYQKIIDKHPNVAWLEVHAENYLSDGGRPLNMLEKIRQDYPISLHCVSMSLGSTDEINWQLLKQLKELSSRIDACLISDHLSWASLSGNYFHHLLPLPYTEESLNHLVSRIQQIQTFFNKQILIENISSYMKFTYSTIPEWEFLVEIAKQSGCGILLDINNIYVTATNLNFSPKKYIHTIPTHLIQEIHLAGFTTMQLNNKDVLIDTHNRAIVPAVWDLYREVIQYAGIKPTIIEWDNELPSLDKLYLEAYRAEQIIRETYVTRRHTA